MIGADELPTGFEEHLPRLSLAGKKNQITDLNQQQQQQFNKNENEKTQS